MSTFLEIEIIHWFDLLGLTWIFYLHTLLLMKLNQFVKKKYSFLDQIEPVSKCRTNYLPCWTLIPTENERYEEICNSFFFFGSRDMQ